MLTHLRVSTERARRASEVTLTPLAPNFPSDTLTSILPFSRDCFSTKSCDNLQWYDWWVHQQVQAQPKELFSAIPRGDTELDVRWSESFGRAWQETARYLTTHTSRSIDDVVVHLLNSGEIQRTSNPNAMHSLVFAIIGWQTMLYQPNIGSCPLSQLAIESQMGRHQGQCHMALKQGQSACKKPLQDLLLGFGVLLPPRQFSVAETTEEKEVFKRWQTVSPESFNAHFLVVFGGINIKWVDSLPCHLEFDVDSNTLFLFRYPSYCLNNIGLIQGSNQAYDNVLGSCATSSDSGVQWATQEETTQMLQEIIMSFRLLFGQNRASRKLYRSLEPFDNIPVQGIDPFLTTICAEQHLQIPVLGERDNYDLRRNFPILRSKLAILMSHLSGKKPRTWTELWLDKRDSASWLTFWAVIVIGGLGIMLAFLQVILQIVQIVKS